MDPSSLASISANIDSHETLLLETFVENTPLWVVFLTATNINIIHI